MHAETLLIYVNFLWMCEKQTKTIVVCSEAYGQYGKYSLENVL